MSAPLVVELATRQLAAYNRADLEAFCACFHYDVIVLDADGTVTQRGMAEFRARYGKLFTEFTDVHAEVDSRVVAAPHVVERETYSRTNKATGERTGGLVLVRYTEDGGRLRFAQFFRAA